MRYFAKHTNNLPRLKYVLPAPRRSACWNDKSLKERLVRSKLKSPNKIAPGNYKCGSKLCQICDIISLENEFTDRWKNKHIRPVLIWTATVIV